ncbi:MAG: DUF1501 domain-containing protein [Gammaproteobacteria bacterium]
MSTYAAAMASAGFSLTARTGAAQTLALASPVLAPTVVNTMLLGGADLRFLFAPEPGTEYARKYWEARSALYHATVAEAELYSSYEAVWQDLYLPVTAGETVFGIHRSAGWLKSQFDAGRAAIIANVRGSQNRRHDHSQLIVNTGDPNATAYITDRDGWGGRLAEAIDAATEVIDAARTVAVTRDVTTFCHGRDPADRNARTVHAPDTRNFSLSRGKGNVGSPNSSLARALTSYYAELRRQSGDQPDNWPYRKFLQHEASIRAFGDALAERLQALSPEQPAALRDLYSPGLGLTSTYFGRQCASLYDSVLASDLFSLRVASAEYGGWDTHRIERSRFETNIEDVLGTGGGLATLDAALEWIPGARENLTYIFTTDFGRQIAANGDHGTDHGRGNYTIVMGEAVRGGTYGEMFPESEIVGGEGQTRYDQLGSDIEGLTAFENVLYEICEWVEPGTGATVAPEAAAGSLPVEPGVDLSTLFNSV